MSVIKKKGFLSVHLTKLYQCAPCQLPPVGSSACVNSQ